MVRNYYQRRREIAFSQKYPAQITARMGAKILFMSGRDMKKDK